MEPVTISKEQLPAYLNYYDLRKEGIALLQQLGGIEWTDYNIHDPGVTILEHLCFALTELGYKTNEDGVAWANKNNSDSTFFPPANILSTHPATITDFRKLVLDEFRDKIDNVWIEPEQGDWQAYGFYKVIVQLDADLYYDPTSANYETIGQDILSFLNKNRNVAEFFIEVKILTPLLIGIDAVIELDADADESIVAAQIDFALEKIFSQEIEPAALYQLQKL